MRVIYKYELDIFDGGQIFNMPYGSVILTAQNQKGKLILWVDIDKDEEYTDRRVFKVVPTGVEFKRKNVVYINTVQFDGGDLVYHVFEVI